MVNPRTSSAAPGGGGINPDMIPSAVDARSQDRDAFAHSPFYTGTRTIPPLSTSVFRAIDQGASNPRFIRSSLYSVPTSDELLKGCGLPFGVVIQPLADLAHDEDPLPVVDFGKEGPIRCSRCQAYPNPFFQFVNGGRLFICNLCSFSNEGKVFVFSPFYRF